MKKCRSSESIFPFRTGSGVCMRLSVDVIVVVRRAIQEHDFEIASYAYIWDPRIFTSARVVT